MESDVLMLDINVDGLHKENKVSLLRNSPYLCSFNLVYIIHTYLSAQNCGTGW